MKQLFLCFLLILMAKLSHAQICNCLNSLQFLENQVERNSASYQHQMVEMAGNIDKYKQHVAQINKQAALIHDEKNCIGLSAKYLSIIKDGHLSINYRENYFPFKSFSDSDKVRAYFNAFPKLKAEQEESKSPVEGIWYFEDGSYSIEIFKNKDINRDYVGVIHNTGLPYWQPGHIKLELLSINDSTFEGIYWRQQLKPSAAIAHLSKGKLSIGRQVFYADPKLNKSYGYTLGDDLEFKTLSATTNYIRIPSFELKYTNKIDSLIKANLASLLKKPNLIIDLRGNGGGGDNAYYPLLPLVFDKKQITFPMRASVWVSFENLSWYDRTKYDGAETKKDSLDAQKEIDELKEDFEKFSRFKFVNDTLDTIYNAPRKIAIIANYGCASSTEGFVLLSRQSKKVKLYGENTYGAISYGDWRRINIAGLPIWITNTTKKMNFLDNIQIEGIGITPDKSLSQYYYRDWLDQVKLDIEK